MLKVSSLFGLGRVYFEWALNVILPAGCTAGGPKVGFLEAL